MFLFECVKLSDVYVNVGMHQCIVSHQYYEIIVILYVAVWDTAYLPLLLEEQVKVFFTWF